MSDPIKLYWWNNTPNFGDTIGKDIVEYVSSRPVTWANARDADLFSVGSLMVFVRRAHSTPRDGAKPYIWGCGSIGPHRMDFKENVEFCAVRGPLTETLLEMDGLPYGDPGLLISRVVEKAPSTGKFGIVLHHSQQLTPEQNDKLSSDNRFVFIDVAAADHLGVVKQISECDLVFSSSLHGLIVADSYSIPNIWLSPNSIHNTPKFKFYDYANAIGRVLGRPKTIADIIPIADVFEPFECPYANAIEDVCKGLIDAFPDNLRGEPK